MESLVICEYLEDRWPASEARSAQRRAACRLFVDRYSAAMPYMPLLRAEEGSEAEAEARRALEEGMRAVDAFLCEYADGDGPFFFGESFSLAEEACAPFALRLMRVLPALRPQHDPASMLEALGLARLTTWLDAVVQRPSVTSTAPPASDMVAASKLLLERMKGAAK